MHDVIVINTLTGIFTDAKLDVNMPVARRQSTTMVTSDKDVINLIYQKPIDIFVSGRLSPTEYKSQVIGPGFSICGAWGNTILEENGVSKINLIYDQAMNDPRRFNIGDLKLVSEFVMNEFKPDGKYCYGFADDDHKGSAIVLDRGLRVAVFWDSGPIDLGDNTEEFRATYDDHYTNIANPECAEIVRKWLNPGEGQSTKEIVKLVRGGIQQP